MFGENTKIILSALAGILLSSLYFVNQFYQKRANDYADNLLKDNLIEYNKQIKANGYRCLISRCIWGVLFLSGFIFNFQAIISQGFRWITLFVFLIGIVYIIWGIYGFKSEIKKIKDFK